MRILPFGWTRKLAGQSMTSACAEEKKKNKENNKIGLSLIVFILKISFTKIKN